MADKKLMAVFEKIAEWNKIGRSELPEDMPDLCIDLLNEETNELIIAIQTGNFTEISDGIVDIIWILGSVIHTFGINLDSLENYAKAVEDSNFTKYSKDKVAMSQYAQANGAFLEENDGWFFVKNASGKIMKGPFYKHPKEFL